MYEETCAGHRFAFAVLWCLPSMVCAGSCAQAGPYFDLTAPVIVEVCGRSPTSETLSLSPYESIEIRFSERIDESSVTPDRVLLVVSEDLADCSQDRDCVGQAPGRFVRCLQGICQASMVDADFLRDAEGGSLSKARKALVVPALVQSSGRLVTVSPVAPLDPNRIYDLIITGAITDLAANPLVDGRGRPGTQLRLRTSDPISTCIRAALVRPAAGVTEVPTNLGGLVIVADEFVSWDVIGAVILAQAQVPGGAPLSWRQVSCPPSALVMDLTGNATGIPLTLGADGTEGESDRDATRHSRVCYEADMPDPLLPGAKYELRAPPPGRAGARPGRCLDLGTSGWFAAAGGPQEEVARILQADLVQQGPCTELVLGASAPVEWVVRAWPQGLEGVGDPQWMEIWSGQVSSCRFSLDAGTVQKHLSLVVTATDFFGRSESAGPFDLAPQPGPKVMMTEVLANPAGSEPDQEFVELLNIGQDPVSLSGWSLATGPGDGDGQVISTGLLAPGQFALLVGPGYDPLSGSDEPVAAGALVIHLDRNLSGNGLSNSGEALFLLDGFGRLVSAYDHPLSVSAGRYNGVSVERTSRRVCVPGTVWQANPKGRSTPGAANDSWR